MREINRLYQIVLFFVFLALPFCVELQAKDFVIVIDAGHGGHDPGAVGRFSKEKNINLKVALKVGKLIEKGCKDVKVIYTRKTDVFIPLARRAEIANENKADLFLSVHTNSLANNKTAKGSSTWTLGLAKSSANLDVAKRENAVILYEDDYQKRYAGFNPNSAESYIIFEFMQDKYMEQSVHLASLVQKQFKGVCGRPDHGVHQAGFLVLKASAMPSILVELGYISTPSEEKYLNSEAGSTSLANGIYRAFLTYKRERELRASGTSRTTVPTGSLAVVPEPETKATAKDRSSQVTKQGIVTVNSVPEDEIVFKIQILTAPAPLRKNDSRLKGLKGVDYYKENGIYKYTYGDSSDYNEVYRTRRSILSKFKDCFIIAFRGGEKMDINEAITLFKQNKKK